MGNALNVLFLGLFSLHLFSLTFPPSLSKHLVVTLNASWFLLNLSLLYWIAEIDFNEPCFRNVKVC